VDKKAEALAVLESLLKERHRNVAAVRGLLDDVTGMSRLRGGGVMSIASLSTSPNSLASSVKRRSQRR